MGRSGDRPRRGAALAAAALVSLTRRATVTLATNISQAQELATHERGVERLASVRRSDAYANLSLSEGVPAAHTDRIARRSVLPGEVIGDAERVFRTPAELDARSAVEIANARSGAPGRIESCRGRLLPPASLPAEAQEDRDADSAPGKGAERRAREQASAFLLDARQKVEERWQPLWADEEKGTLARRLVEEGLGGRRGAGAVRKGRARRRRMGRAIAGQRVRITAGTGRARRAALRRRAVVQPGRAHGVDAAHAEGSRAARRSGRRCESTPLRGGNFDSTSSA